MSHRTLLALLLLVLLLGVVCVTGDRAYEARPMSPRAPSGREAPSGKDAAVSAARPAARSARPPSEADAQPTRAPERWGCVVAEGDTLSAVARRNGVTLGDIIRLNGISAPRRIVPGAELLLRPVGVDGIAGRPAAEDVVIDVLKKERKVELRIRGKLVRTYRCALGRAPEGDKEREGDRRTPEGEFYVCQRLARGKYGPSLGISYPDAEDAERGLRSGLITGRAHREIVESIRARRRPPWTTKLGGAICIHGRGAGRDWTLGCIALDDADAGELFVLTPMRAKVRIAAGRAE